MPVLLPLTTEARTRIVLDPEGAINDRVELELNDGPIRIMEPGPDWGDAAIEQFLADQRRGKLPVDFTVPNRQIQIPLILGADEAANYDDARAALQAKVSLIQREGSGAISRGNGLYADVVNATLKLPDRYGTLHGVESDVLLVLEALPDFYGDEVLAGTASGDGEVVVELNDIAGDYPGRLRVVVANTDAAPQRGALIGMRNRHATDDAEAAFAFAAADLTPLDTAAVAGSAVEHTSLATAWTPILSTEIDGVGAMTHKGTYKVWALAECPLMQSPPAVRLAWAVGDITFPTENPAVALPSAGNPVLMSLGQVRLDELPIGDHTWHGQIQARATGDPGEEVTIHKVWIVPVGDGYCELAAADVITDGLTTLLARDSFADADAGDPLEGRTPDLGAVWDTGGTSADFELTESTSGYPYRNAAVSSGVAGVEYAMIGSNITGQRVSAVHGFPAPAIGSGLIARFHNGSYYAYMLFFESGPGRTTLWIGKVVGGIDTVLASTTFTGEAPASGCRLDLQIDEDGNAIGRIGDIAGNTLATVTALADADLATGGDIEDGRGGFMVADNPGRWFTDVRIAEPATPAAVVYGDSLLEIRTDGVYRQAVDNSSYRRLTPAGELLRVPPAGLEDRATQLFIKTSRGDLGQIPDGGEEDPLEVTAYYRPSWLTPIRV